MAPTLDKAARPQYEFRHHHQSCHRSCLTEPPAIQRQLGAIAAPSPPAGHRKPRTKASVTASVGNCRPAAAFASVAAE
jgi:hypothetical protein